MNKLILAMVALCLSCGSDTVVASFCGDGVLDPDEVCDGQSAIDTLTCHDYGFIRGDLGCSLDCLRRTTDSCVSVSDKEPACGDNILDPGEECDVELPPLMDCVRLGYQSGELTCSASCTLDRTGCSDQPDGAGGEADDDPGSDPTSCPESDHLACYQGDVWSYVCGERTTKSKECGTGGPTGDSFCMGDDLYILHQTVGCDVDQCTSSTDPQLQKTCTDGCTNGACVECAPSDDSYACNGGDVYWYDACGLPSGTKEDCGDEGYVGSTYCSGSNVYQDYRQIGCDGDQCTSQDSPVKQEDCGSGTCNAGSCVECGNGAEDVQGCNAGQYCPPGSRTRECIDNEWSSWGACEGDGKRYYGDGGTHCGPVLCLTMSPTGGNSSLTATLNKNGGGSFDNDIYLVMYAPGTGDDVNYGCVSTNGMTAYEFALPMGSLAIDLGETLEINAQIFSPCNNGGQHNSGNALISQCSE